jgi:O-antigen/teichoic acid export membrane protein
MGGVIEAAAVGERPVQSEADGLGQVEMIGARRRKSQTTLVGDVIGTYATRLANISLSLITGIITARMLGPHKRGVFSLIYLFASTIVTFIKLGGAQASVYSIRRGRVPAERVAANALIVALVLGSISGVIVFLFRHQLMATFLRGVPEWSVLMSLPLIPVLLFESYFNAIVQALGMFGLYNRRMLIGTASLVFGIFVCLVIFNGGLPAAILVVVCNPIAMDSWLLATVYRMLRFPLRLDWELLGRELRFGLKSHVQILAQHLHLRADVYLVAYFLNPAEVAFYVMSVRLAEFMLDIPRTVGMVMYPRLASLDDAAMHRMAAQGCRRTLLITTTAAVLIGAAGPSLIVLWYGRAYAPAARPLPFIAAGIVMMSVLVLLTQTFTSRNKQQVNIVVGFIALSGNLGLNLVLIPMWGIVGAALASMISYTAAAALLVVLFLRESRLSVVDVLIPRVDDLQFFWGVAMRAARRGKGLAVRLAA